MIKDIIEKNEIVKVNDKEMAVLKENFPSCFDKDGKFDILKFQEVIKDKVDITKEGYELNFLGKSYAKLLASIDTTTVIKPDLEYNNKPENKNSENIYISGDNIDALKHLAKSYAGQVKCIYIDPPYNTGSDGFVYNDKFEFTVEDLVQKLSISEDEAARILDMTKRGSASHSAWLTFMYPRLLLARDMLKDDGAIFISIDNNENDNIKLLCDLVFGEENYAGQLPRITKKSGKDHTNGVASNNDYLLIYLRNSFSDLTGVDANIDDYKERDEYFNERGPFKLNQTLDYDSLWYNPTMDFTITVKDSTFVPGGDTDAHNARHAGNHNAKDWVWRWSQAKFDFGYANGFVVIKDGKGRKRIYTKTYYGAKIVKKGNIYSITKIDRDKKLSSIALVDNKYSNDNATKEIGVLLNKNIFDFPKPTCLIKTILDLMPDDIIIMDFFSGSGTVGDAVMQQNLDGGTRKYILVQLDEKCKIIQDGFRTIDEIGQKRVELAAKKIKKENPDADIDFGFKHYTLVEPTSKTIDKLESFEQNSMVTDNDILKEFGKETVLATWLNDDGYGLTCEPQEIDLAGYKAYYMGNHLYLLDAEFNNDAQKALFERYSNEPSFNPENIVLFGYSFSKWTIMDSLQTNLRQLSNKKINFDIRY
ncbi:MAG: site-specific DNA-methyltransferase [Eubacteriales bacterium]